MFYSDIQNIYKVVSLNIDVHEWSGYENMLSCPSFLLQLTSNLKWRLKVLDVQSSQTPLLSVEWSHPY